MEEWRNGDFIKFNQDECKVLLMGWNNPTYYYSLKLTVE